MKSSEEYAASGFGHCPVCGSDEIQGGPVDVDGNQATQEVSCDACNSTWDDVYTLTGYRNLDDLEDTKPPGPGDSRQSEE